MGPSTRCDLRQGMAVAKPILLELHQRVDSVQHGRLEGVIVTDFEPEDVLDALVVRWRDDLRLGVRRGRRSEESGFE